VIKDILYPGAAKGDRRRSFDLYLPAKLNGKPPLLIFLHGGFWLLSDDDYRIGQSIAENLVQDGVAVAPVRYRLAPALRARLHSEPGADLSISARHLRRADRAHEYIELWTSLRSRSDLTLRYKPGSLAAKSEYVIAVRAGFAKVNLLWLCRRSYAKRF
jgi:BD-FAE protein